MCSKAELSVRKRHRKRIAAVEREPLPMPTGLSQNWSVDFFSDGWPMVDAFAV
ncbi:hypothetical protein [Burkholderia sp. 8Y]|uniref:hypothetical protein n=1 Tax=Burkholderia sp. 8Y TaxID=2653133 RepID=UPI001359B045|nr:hypothetical protein [Burkholderia sp. 8Y]